MNLCDIKVGQEYRVVDDPNAKIGTPNLGAAVSVVSVAPDLPYPILADNQSHYLPSELEPVEPDPRDVVLDAIQEAWASWDDDTAALRAIRMILEETGR